MYKVQFENKPFTVVFDDAKEFENSWCLLFFDNWQVVDKKEIKSVEEI